MLFGHSVVGIIALSLIFAVSLLASKIYRFYTDVRLPDKFLREIDFLATILQQCEQLVYSKSHGSLYETRALTQTVSDCRTSLKELEQLLKEWKIDDGTTLRRTSQFKRKLYVSQTNIERLKTFIATCVSQRQALSLAQKRLLVPDDASAVLRSLVEEPTDVPISDAAGSLDNMHIIYSSDKDLGAMRGPHKRRLEGRDKNLSLPWVPGSPGSGKSTTFPVEIDTNFTTSNMCCSYRLGDRVFFDRQVGILPTMNRSQGSWWNHGLDGSTTLASSSLSETRSSLNDKYDSCKICVEIDYNILIFKAQPILLRIKGKSCIYHCFVCHRSV